MWYSFQDYNETLFDCNEFWQVLIDDIVNTDLQPSSPFIIKTFYEIY